MLTFQNLDLSYESLLRDANEATVRSLNGCRNADEILRLVPNVKNFRITLRCLKFWAKRRGIHSNKIESDEAHWSSLFKPYPFFKSYNNYLQVDLIARNEGDLHAWKGWVETRLRHLIGKASKKHAFGFGYAICRQLDMIPFYAEFDKAGMLIAQIHMTNADSFRL